MMKFLGLCVRASMYGVQNRRNYWREVAQYNPVDFKFSSVMTREHFERVLASLILPSADGTVDTSNEVDDAIWGNVKAFAKACFTKWQQAWGPGGLLTIDETMVSWEGTSPAHISYITRKPHPLGFQVKGLHCSRSRIMLNAEFCEGERVDIDKEHVAQWGKSTAVTLRASAPYHGTFRTVIGDSYFGSCNTAVAMRLHQLYFIGNVKTGHWGYPKAYLKQVCSRRGEQCFLTKTWPLVPTRQAAEAPPDTPTVEVIAGAHCDKKPTCLVGTRGRSTPGATATRFFR